MASAGYRLSHLGRVHNEAKTALVGLLLSVAFGAGATVGAILGDSSPLPLWFLLISQWVGVAVPGVRCWLLWRALEREADQIVNGADDDA